MGFANLKVPRFSSAAVSVLLISIFTFSFIYKELQGLSYLDALYYSTMVACTIGPPSPPKNKKMKFFISMQAILTILMGIALIREFNKD